MFKSDRMMNIVIPVVSVVLGLLVGAFVMLFSGYNPLQAYGSLIAGVMSDSYYIGETIRQVTPYILAGLAVAFAFRTGLFNIGVEGQVIVGWVAAVWVGIAVEAPMYIHLPLSLLAAAVAGGVWAFIPGILKAKLGVHEVIVTIMMNYVALYTTNSLIRNVLTDNQDRTETIAPTATLTSAFLENVTLYSRMHWGILIAMAAAIVMWFLLERTTKGYELKAVGFNTHAANYAGMSVPKNIVLSMVISGIFAGLAGAMEGLGTFEYASVKSGFTNIGFDGIAVALLGVNTAIGVVLAAILFGGLKFGSLNMPLEAGVPTEVVDIIIAVIIFFVASSYMIRFLIARRKKGGQ
ncbi:ABC transporter permease [Bacillus fonticola]|uniref:ABC transporter permease n=1 Tax=Bacillus fonticola TaxID=2728853 RepID=UPI001472E439|nr:ABC transporter permease [Bacillus fonticola]